MTNIQLIIKINEMNHEILRFSHIGCSEVHDKVYCSNVMALTKRQLIQMSMCVSVRCDVLLNSLIETNR